MSQFQQYPGQPQGAPMNNLDMRNPNNFLKTVSPMMTSFGGEMLEKQTSTWFSNFSVFWNSLKIYFAVNKRFLLLNYCH
jgi:hypothetical protein